MSNVHWHDVQELACAVCGLDYEDTINNGRDDEIDDALEEKLGVDFDGFMAVAAALLPLVTVAKGGLSDTVRKGFGKDGLWLLCEEVS